MNVAAVIPARYASTRFPGKVLADICGKTMIERVYEGVRCAMLISRVVVATDDERVRSAVQRFGGEAVMTSKLHSTGTDRVAEAAVNIDAEVVVNVQGDEPLITAEAVESAVRPLLDEPELEMSTLMCPIDDAEEFFDPNVVKVITDNEGYAIYFSRWPIPFHRDEWSGCIRAQGMKIPAQVPRIANRHVGLYAYRKSFLLRFTEMPRTALEKLEQLEQLRALENGYRIKVVKTDYRAIGVDVPEDIELVRAMLSEGC